MLFVVVVLVLAVILLLNFSTPRKTLLGLTALLLSLGILTACGGSSGATANTTANNGGASTGTGSNGGSTSTTATSVSQVSASSANISSGSSMSATVTLNAPAPSSGAQVSLTSSNSSVASVPANVMVAAGQNSVSFTVTTGSVSSDTSVSITAAYNNTTAAIALSVKAPPPTPSTVTVFVVPTSISLSSQGSLQFTALVSGSTNTAVSWTSSGGSITSSGMFTAPSVTSTTVLTVSATSQADPKVVTSAQVTVTPIVSPGGGTYSGSGPVASWQAYEYLFTDNVYHQAILISNAKGTYPVIGYSYRNPDCTDLGDTANDSWTPIGNGLWFFLNKPQLVYVKWIWYNNATDKQIVQQTPCIDYSGAPKYN